MKAYKEFQFGWMIVGSLVPVQILFIYLYAGKIGDHPLETNIFLAVSLFVILTFLLFYGLTTLISGDKIIVSFGIGIIRKRIKISRIISVAPVRTPWYYGWGIRFIPNGILYNIGGLESVELRFNDTNRVIRIGSREPSKLKEEIEKRLASR